jgi:hypothetical protein
MSIRFGAATLFVQSKNAVRVEERHGSSLYTRMELQGRINQRFQPAIEKYLQDQKLCPDEVHVIPMSKARCLVVDGPDFATFAKALVLAERKVQNPLHPIKEFLRCLITYNPAARLPGSSYTALEDRTAEAFIQHPDLKTVDLDA